MSCPYTQWYFARQHTEGFGSYADFIALVGTRPDGTFFLERITKPKEKGVPMTPDNYVWITKEAMALAQKAELRPPQFPLGTRTPLEQANNDRRFALYSKGVRAYAERRKKAKERMDEWELELAMLMDKIAEYVVSRGHSESQALDPKVLPAETYPKLNAARDRARLLMKYISGMYPSLEALRKLNERQKARREEDRAALSLNRAYSGKRGRPLERFVQVRKRIGELTPAQRTALGIPKDQDFLVITKPNGRKARVWTVRVSAPNPKLQQNGAPTEQNDQGQTAG